MNPPPPLDLDSLRQWVLSLCVVRFDLHRGQLLEHSFPPNSISPLDEPLIAFSSFPDSLSQRPNPNHNPNPNRTAIQDSLFFFRVKAPSSGAFLFGHVFNRQRHDERLARGGEQKSVVVVSHLPLTCVFFPLLRVVGPHFFNLGPASLHAAACHIATWPPPSPSTVVRAPLPSPVSVPVNVFDDADVYGTFKGVLPELWLLWELTVAGEPLLIVAQTPGMSSAAVAALVGLTAPLVYGGDYRPYFTIHDPDFSLLNGMSDGAPLPAVMLGVTNLFVLKSLRGFRHVAAVGGKGTGKAVGLMEGIKNRRLGPLSLMTGFREGVWSSYQGVVKADNEVLKRMVESGNEANNEVLRRHFMELTTSFLAPFGPYFRPVMPVEGSLVYGEAPRLPAFRVEEFLKGLGGRGPGKFLGKRMKGNWLDFYRRFLKGSNFMPWFQKRREIAEIEQQRLWRQARMKADVNKLISSMSELEVVDSFNAIEAHLLRETQLEQSGKGYADSGEACQKLKTDLEAVFRVLPKDTQQLLLSNPQRASLLSVKI